MWNEKETARKNAYQENQHRTYVYKNRGLEIKTKTMELLYEQLKLLEKESQSCRKAELLEVRKTMALLGQAILPD